MLQLSSLTKGYGDRLLFENVNWQIAAGDRVGLCGPNGAGKTTLLRMVAGLDDADGGSVIKQAAITVGYLPQDGLSHSGRTLLDEVSTAFQPLLTVKRAMHEIEEQLADQQRSPEDQEAMLERYSDLQHRFRDEDGYTIELRVAGVLAGLGFTPEQYEQPTDTFSGGWQMRIALATLILRQPHVLLLDEPTNHLDLEARNWLEDFLGDYPYALILVSHDRYFMDRVVTRIAEVGLRTLTPYNGSYSEYLVAREARISALLEQKRRQDEEITRVRLFVDRFRYQATKAAQVQSRIKMLDKIVPIEVPVARKRVHFSFPDCRRSGRIALELSGVRKVYGTAVVLDGIAAHIERGDRIAIVGPNGAGKSTLMRMLSGAEAPDAGERIEGHNLVAQYFAQDEATRLDPKLTVYDTLGTSSSTEMLPSIRNILGGFLFSGDDIHKPVGVLSGGERTRLAVARMLLQPSNTLMLDEPTNHLDIDSTNVLLDALKAFQGTLIFVSHDRYFVEQLATSIIEVGHGEASRYPGTYEEFRWSKNERATTPSEPSASAPAAARPQKRPAAAKPAATPSGKSARDERRRRNQNDRRQQRAQSAKLKRVDDLERRIADREKDIRDVEGLMAAPGFYDDRDAAQPVITRYEKLMWEVGDLMGQWEALQEATGDQESAP
jgi:ATP-binding cassette subfamily F protein 3